MQVALDHFPPFGFDLLGYLGIAVAGKVYKVKLAVDIIIVDGLGFARLSRGAGVRFPVHQAVDQGRFSHV